MEDLRILKIFILVFSGVEHLFSNLLPRFTHPKFKTIILTLPRHKRILIQLLPIGSSAHLRPPPLLNPLPLIDHPIRMAVIQRDVLLRIRSTLMEGLEVFLRDEVFFVGRGLRDWLYVLFVGGAFVPFVDGGGEALK